MTPDAYIASIFGRNWGPPQARNMVSQAYTISSKAMLEPIKTSVIYLPPLAGNRIDADPARF